MPERGPRATRIDREAVDRVLHRALELHDHDEGLSLQLPDLVDVGRELGVAPQHVEQAYAEELAGQLSRNTPQGRGARLTGPGIVSTGRVMARSADAVQREVDDWMQRRQSLRRVRIRAGSLTWERRDDPIGMVTRAVRSVTGEGRLGDLREVGLEVVALPDGSSAVHLGADLRDRRLGALYGGAGTAAIGVGAAVVAGVFVSPIALVAGPFAAAAGVAVAASHRRTVKEVHRELERTLDLVEQRQIAPPNAIGTVTNGVKRAINKRRTRNV